MKVILQQRAEIARRSLILSEKNQVVKAIASLNELNFEKALSSPNFHKLAGLSQTQLYAYRVNSRLRLIISIDEDKWIVEDIVDHLGHLNRLFSLQDKA
ncbi:MAG: hypothetical protein ACOYN8_11975 [Pseudanabaena sp.]|jgi:hypothetical protein